MSFNGPGSAVRANVLKRFPSILIVTPVHFTRATLRTRSMSLALLTHCCAGGSTNATAGEIGRGLRSGLALEPGATTAASTTATPTTFASRTNRMRDTATPPFAAPGARPGWRDSNQCQTADQRVESSVCPLAKHHARAERYPRVQKGVRVG